MLVRVSQIVNSMYIKVITVLPVVLLAARAAPPQPAADLARLARDAQQAAAAGDFERAAALYRRILAARPDLAEVHANLGMLYYGARRYAEAAPAFGEALKRSPSLHRARLFLGICHAQTGRFAEAAAQLEKARPLAPDRELRRISGLHLHRAYAALKRWGEAGALLEQLAQADPDDPDVLFEAARFHSGRSLVALEKLATAAPESNRFHQALAEVYEVRGDPARARAELESVRVSDPLLPNVHFQLGRLRLREAAASASLEQARALFEQELKVNPLHAGAEYEIGELERRAGKLDEAARRFERAIELEGEFVEARLALGALHLAAGRLPAALLHLAEAARLDPLSQVAYYRLAQAYRLSGREPEAEEATARFRALRQASGSRQAAFFREIQRNAVTAQSVEEPLR